MTPRVLSAMLAAAAVLLAAGPARGAISSRPTDFSLRRSRWSAVLRLALDEGRIDKSFGSRRLLAVCILVGAIMGFALAGLPAAAIGAIAAPLGARSMIRSRRHRHAARIDACAAELAQALAAALAAGRSLRGALMIVSEAIAQPLSREIERVVVDIAMGETVSAALETLRARTGSARIESLSGAIELHRGSGGDLIKLMRELSEAFRERDRAMQDAHSASAQARFTAYVVAAMPVLVAVAMELAAPGSVSGALSLLPTALMMLSAGGLLLGGVFLARRLATVRA